MSTPIPRKRKVLLLGAGELGTSILTALAASSLSNTTFTLAVRTPSKYTHLAERNPQLSIISLDLSCPSATLVPTFAGYDVVISCTGFGQDPNAVVKLAEEILAAGKLKKSIAENEGGEEGNKRLWFFPWQFGVDYDRTANELMPLFAAQLEVRNLLRSHAASSNVRWTIVSTGIFMSFLFEAFWGVVVRKNPDTGAEEKIWDAQNGSKGGNKGKIHVRALTSPSHRITVTDVKDIGTVLARIIADDLPSSTSGLIYVAGDTLSYSELADTVEEWAGQEVEREVWTLEYLKEELKEDPEDGIRRYRVVFAQEGVSWDKGGTVNERLGVEMLDVRGYLEGKK